MRSNFRRSTGFSDPKLKGFIAACIDLEPLGQRQIFHFPYQPGKLRSFGKCTIEKRQVFLKSRIGGLCLLKFRDLLRQRGLDGFLLLNLSPEFSDGNGRRSDRHDSKKRDGEKSKDKSCGNQNFWALGILSCGPIVATIAAKIFFVRKRHKGFLLKLLLFSGRRLGLK